VVEAPRGEVELISSVSSAAAIANHPEEVATTNLQEVQSVLVVAILDGHRQTQPGHRQPPEHPHNPRDLPMVPTETKKVDMVAAATVGEAGVGVLMVGAATATARVPEGMAVAVLLHPEDMECQHQPPLLAVMEDLLTVAEHLMVVVAECRRDRILPRPAHPHLQSTREVLDRTVVQLDLGPMEVEAVKVAAATGDDLLIVFNCGTLLGCF